MLVWLARGAFAAGSAAIGGFWASAGEPVASPPLVRPIDPAHVKPYDHQAGGHPVYSHDDGSGRLPTLLKPIDPTSARGEREMAFYSQRHRLGPLIRFVPEFYGVVTDGSKTYLELEDATGGLDHPSVADIKLGRRTYGPDASAKKIASQTSKYPHQARVGFRVTGTRRWLGPVQGWRARGKAFGRSLATRDVPSGLGEFLGSGHGAEQTAGVIVDELSRLHDAVAAANDFRLYASSALIVIGQPCPGDDARRTAEVRVKLIDFAHAHTVRGNVKAGRDENLLYGVRSLADCFQHIIDRGLLCP